MKVLRQTRRPILALVITLIILFTFYFYVSKVTSRQRWSEKHVRLRDIYLRDDVARSKKEIAKRSTLDADKQKRRRTFRRESLEDSVDRRDDYSTDESKANYVREMMLHAWNNYKQFAWGKNELAPISKNVHNQGIFGSEDGSRLAATIVDSLDTLLIMGLNKEYEEGREYIRNHFDISAVNNSVSVFEVNIRFLGGFLAAYALTKDPLYIEKAEQVGGVLLKAFRQHTHMPTSFVVPHTGEGSSSGIVVLAEVGTLHLEFLQLSRLTHNRIYLQKVKAIRNRLDFMEKMDGLYGNALFDDHLGWANRRASLGGEGDSFYEYLLKSYVQSDKRDVQAWRMYQEAIRAIERKMKKVSESGLTYIGNWYDGVVEKEMSHLACFAPGMFALQSKYEVNVRKKQRAMKLAEDLAHTCHESYVRSATHIGPESFHFLNAKTDATTVGLGRNYILRPEVIEGFFYLWRLTKKQMYKDWIWNATQAINKYCRVDNGFSGIRDVYNAEAVAYDNVQQSFFLAETLKYIYLTFVDDSVISLDDWVFNTEAHPLPIIKRRRKRYWG